MNNILKILLSSGEWNQFWKQAIMKQYNTENGKEMFAWDSYVIDLFKFFIQIRSKINKTLACFTLKCSTDKWRQTQMALTCFKKKLFISVQLKWYLHVLLLHISYFNGDNCQFLLQHNREVEIFLYIKIENTFSFFR